MREQSVSRRTAELLGLLNGLVMALVGNDNGSLTAALQLLSPLPAASERLSTRLRTATGTCTVRFTFTHPAGGISVGERKKVIAKAVKMSNVRYYSGTLPNIEQLHVNTDRF
ncbi:unnamed protein product [Ceratitis capitata]|uniref:(Mediterranean fruit fly) hypothetical protein n=1 Tax=Ceratitis capitata TaxID=7213 RepID=A0A811U5C9_CERCA|nr:unnamed protein product [Ceratitis capitata]